MSARPPLALAIAALLAAPVAVHAAQKKPAPAPAPARSPPPSLSIGGWIGYEAGDLDGLQLRLDVVKPYQRLSPQVELALVGSVGYSRLTESVSAPGNTTDVTANILKLVPAARFSLPLNADFSLFGDAGVGLYLAFSSIDHSSAALLDSSRTDVGLMLRLGAGAVYRLSPRTHLGASLVLDPMFGGYDDVTFSFLAGVTYQP